MAKASGVEASIEHVTALIEHAAAHHLLHEPSMLQDRKAGRGGSEIDALNGAVAAQGEAMGVAVQINRTLATLVRLAEAMPQYRRTTKEALG